MVRVLGQMSCSLPYLTQLGSQNLGWGNEGMKKGHARAHAPHTHSEAGTGWGSLLLPLPGPLALEPVDRYSTGY